ncbi:MAG TPA: hypothetical protein VKB88_32970 [Bryobacteraceae bacterium]|nr:hypothetical protein [Bryobacteraceae bacterium]
MKPITAENRTTGSPTYVPLPWDAFATFSRMVWVGFLVVFGPYSGRRTNEAQEPNDTSPNAKLVQTSAAS